MSLFVYLPPLISIFLIVISSIADSYLKHIVNVFTVPAFRRLSAEEVQGRKEVICEESAEEVQGRKEVIENIASDWATRLGFINTMVVACVSCFSVYSGTQSYVWTVGTFLFLFVIFICMLIWIISHGAGELTTTRIEGFRIRGKKFLRIRYSTICNIILFIVYVILAVEIYITQSLGPSSLP